MNHHRLRSAACRGRRSPSPAAGNTWLGPARRRWRMRRRSLRGISSSDKVLAAVSVSGWVDCVPLCHWPGVCTRPHPCRPPPQLWSSSLATWSTLTMAPRPHCCSKLTEADLEVIRGWSPPWCGAGVTGDSWSDSTVLSPEWPGWCRVVPPPATVHCTQLGPVYCTLYRGHCTGHWATSS